MTNVISMLDSSEQIFDFFPIIQSVTVIPINKQYGSQLTVKAGIQNTGTIGGEFWLGVSIGKDGIKWYDVDIYIDGKGQYGKLTLAAGFSGFVTRTMKIPNDAAAKSLPEPWDVWVTVKDPSLNLLDEVLAKNVINLSASGISANLISVELI